MDLSELASHVGPTRPSTELRRPPSFERIRPPRFYERGRTGFYEQRPGSRSRSGWRFASSSRSSRGSSLLDERSPKTSRFDENEQSRGPRRSGNKRYEKQPSEGFNRDRRPEVPSRTTQGTMVVYRERKAEDQPNKDFSEKGREGIFESTTDVDREKWRETKGEGSEAFPGNPHGSDFDPTASSSKGASVFYQGGKARDETPQGLRKRYHRNNSDTWSISPKGALVIHGEETSVETTQQLPGRYRNDSVDTSNSQTDALVISNGEKPKDEPAEELPERTRRLVERSTNQVYCGEMSSDNNERPS